MSENTETRTPFLPFARETAIQKIRMAADGWNSRNPQSMSMVYTPINNCVTALSFQKAALKLLTF